MKQSTEHLMGAFGQMKLANGRKTTLADHKANIGRMGRKKWRGEAQKIISIQEDGGILTRSDGGSTFRNGQSTGHTHNPQHPHA